MLFFAMGERGPSEALAQMVRDSTECLGFVLSRHFQQRYRNLEVLAPRVSKASAIRRVAKAEGAERIVVFGDNLNDLPMFCSGRHWR